MVVAGYGLWVILNIAITVFEISDAGVNGHLSLVFTGLPGSLLSLFLPHGSLVAVIVAGLLGLLQWGFVARFWGNLRGERNA